MDALIQLLNRAIKLDPDKILRQILENKELQKEILDLNRNSQLFEKGINSLGIRLDAIGGGYSPYTIKEKQKKGQPTDRVTLKDTGDFYQTFRIILGEKEFWIDADPMKDNTNLFKEWGADVLGLTDESLEELIYYLKDDFIPIVINYLLGDEDL